MSTRKSTNRGERANGIETAGGVAMRLLALLLAIRRRLSVFRVREHLRRTERALRAADTSHLDAERLQRRRDALDTLRAYWQEGAVPTNKSTTGRAPQFVGANGVPCAVAALLLAGGERDLVERVAATDNAVRIEDLDGGPILDWLDDHGLTQAEAARIQPSYHVTEIRLVTDCGPVSCALARTLVSIVALGVAAAVEYVGYRLVGEAFPENPFKRRGWLAYLTVVNLVVAPLLAILLYALFP